MAASSIDAPLRTDRDDVAAWKKAGLCLCFALAMAFLWPVYALNKIDFRRRMRNRPMASSFLVEAQARWPVLYEVAMLIQNFPLYDRIYRKITPLSGRVLQVGSGTGLLNRYLRRTGGIELYNVEPNERAVAWARHWKRLNSATCDSIANRLPFDDESFDQIIFARSFHHIHRLKKAFLECHRLLAKGGRIIIFDPVILEGHARQADAWMGNSSIDGVIWRYTATSLTGLVAKNLPKGLSITSVETDRMPHLTNFNLVVPQTDAVLVISRVE